MRLSECALRCKRKMFPENRCVYAQARRVQSSLRDGQHSDDDTRQPSPQRIWTISAGIIFREPTSTVGVYCPPVTSATVLTAPSISAAR